MGELVHWVPCVGGLLCLREMVRGLQLCMEELVPWVPCVGGRLLCMRELQQALEGWRDCCGTVGVGYPVWES